MARTRRRKTGTQEPASAPAASSAPIDADPTLEVGVEELAPVVEPEPARVSPPKAASSKRRNLGGEYVTQAHVRFGPPRGELPPGTVLTLTDEEARPLLKVNAIKSTED